MNTNGIKIGNLFIDELSKQIIHVIEILRNGNIVFDFECSSAWQAAPIQLTDESFELILGAKKDESGYLFIHQNERNDMRFYLQDGYIQLTKGECCPFMNFKHITTVHAFQNLYFSLNGYELITKYNNGRRTIIL